MEHTILTNSKVKFLNIENHRRNNGSYEFLFKILSHQELDLIQDNINVNSREYIEGTNKIHYHIWIEDITSSKCYKRSFLLSGYMFDIVNFDIKIASMIYGYCKTHDIKTFYCFIYENKMNSQYSAEEQDMKHSLILQLKERYPEHRFIYNIWFYTTHCYYETCYIFSILEIILKGDIALFHSYSNQFVEESDIILFERRMENIETEISETENIVSTNNATVPIENVIERTKKYVNIMDYNSCINNISSETIVLATNDRIGRNSSLKVLPIHLIREICRWF